ncbi:PREDICTED: vascular endothelial growth factor receptor 1, partial [Thamnophis sirtalis]|uniref:Vascular endothelial growth factor receptor 1 n=1 Tax=Thamnophis sirtalis TaxID=35019 RepID=A0A6I9Y9H6_9SAUR
MLSWGLPGAVLGGLLGFCLLLAGSSSGFKWKGPKLNITGAHHVIQEGDTLNLLCSGDVPHSWFLPKTLSRNDNRLNTMTFACGKHNKHFCSSLTLNRAQATDTGYYSCKYPSSSEVKKKTGSKIYVFINDTKNPFIKLHTNIPETIHTTDGQELVIPCRVTAPDIHVKLRKASKRATISRSIHQRKDEPNLFYSILVVDKVHDIDKGQYICNVKSGPSFKSDSVNVFIYDKAFITLQHGQKNMLDVVSGKKSYRLSMKVKAFPTPEVVWLKDGLPAAEMCARYKIRDFSLIIKHVAEEDAGNYTIMLSTRQWNLQKNLTMTLRINVKPQIYEKVSSIPGPNLYQLGTKQILTCIVYGIPHPVIKWTWQPCQQNHSRTRYDSCSSSENSLVLTSESTTGNRIQSITQRTVLIEGKNKTASILVVAESRTSGTYSCIASNKVGKDKRDISYFVTGIVLGPGNQSLLIERVQESDAGSYQCIATNLKGMVTTSAYVTIQGPLMVIVEYCKYGNLSGYLKSKRDLFSAHKYGSIQRDPLMEKKDVEPISGQKKRLENVPSRESLASSGFQEDKNLSDVEEEEEDVSDFYKRPLTMEDLISYSFQVARGMEFLSSQKPSAAEIKTDYLSIIMDPEEVPLDEQCERLPYEASKWEFARERLKL